MGCPFLHLPGGQAVHPPLPLNPGSSPMGFRFSAVPLGLSGWDGLLQLALSTTQWEVPLPKACPHATCHNGIGWKGWWGHLCLMF